jgi:hypothetical protein
MVPLDSRGHAMPSDHGPRALLRHDAALVAIASLACAATWTAVYGHWTAGAAFLLPGSLAQAFVLPLALSSLRGHRAVAGVAYAAAALLHPLFSYWDRFPYLLGQIPSPTQLGPADALSGLPCAAFGLLLLRKPRPVGGIPGPSALADALQAVLAACLVGILASAVSRGGQFGIGYFAASLALMAGLFKAGIVKGALAAVAALVVARGGATVPRLAAATALSAGACGAAYAATSETALAWAVGFGLALLSRLSRSVRIPIPGRRRRTAALAA